jgi:quercetin dioxygenase-like cupin family protein
VGIGGEGSHRGRKRNMTAQATPTVVIDNDRVRVTKWRFASGAATGWHRHQMDYVVVPMADGVLELVGADGGRTRAELKKGVAYFREAGVEHDVINANPTEFAFVEIELK